MDLNLADRRAVVCGSSQGIGKAAAIELALLGANVILLSRNATTLNLVKGDLDTSQGQQHEVVTADFTDLEQVRSASAQILQNGGAHILVNNTGGPPAGSAIDADLDSFVDAFSNHLLCNHILTQAFVEGMKQARYGRIINVISTSVKQPIAGLGVSNTTRGAVANWAKTLASELGPFGITVNNMLPGMTMTGRLQSLIDGRAQNRQVPANEIAEAMKAEIPARRFAEPREAGAAVAFLASPAAAYINGINLPVDGGRTTCL